MAKWPYNTGRWARLRAAKLRANPLCEYCPPGVLTLAEQVDHRQAIRDGGEPWAWENLASCCPSCHSRKTGQERAGKKGPPRIRDIDPATGRPLDPRHWWNQKISGS